MPNKKVVIVGGGVSGLSAGVYALDNGYDVLIIERNPTCGGQLTGWTRKGTFIDGCAHWIVGTNPKSALYPLWRHVGAIDDSVAIHPTEYFTKYVIGDETVTLYADLKKLKEELLRVAPEDKRKIKRFINGIKAYRHTQVPAKKPLDMMNVFELTAFGFHFVPMLHYFISSRKKSLSQFADEFRSPILRTFFREVMGADYNLHSLYYVLAELSRDNAGMVEGGSLQMARRMQARFLEMGGLLRTSTSVSSIDLEGDKVVGVTLDDGEKIPADYVIASTDVHHLLHDLLGGKVKDPFFEERFEKRDVYPLNPAFLVAFRTSEDITSWPKQIVYKLDEPIQIADTTIQYIPARNHAFDKLLNKRFTSINVLIPLKDGVYDYLKGLSREDYLKLKEELGEKIRQGLISKGGYDPDKIELIDVATPLTYERYTNSYRGSYMSFITTGRSHGLMRDSRIRGVKNLLLCGQWLMSPGGLPIALFTGKHAAIHLCRLDKKRFINREKEERYVILRPSPKH